MQVTNKRLLITLITAALLYNLEPVFAHYIPTEEDEIELIADNDIFTPTILTNLTDMGEEDDDPRATINTGWSGGGSHGEEE